jgi:hypothetical protein
MRTRLPLKTAREVCPAWLTAWEQEKLASAAKARRSLLPEMFGASAHLLESTTVAAAAWMTGAAVSPEGSPESSTESAALFASARS